VIGRRKGDNCIIYDTPVSAFREMRNGWKSDLHNATHAAADREHLTPVSLLAPWERPPGASLDVRVVSRQGRSTRHGSIFVRYVHRVLFLLGTVAGATRPQRVKRLRPRFRISVLGWVLHRYADATSTWKEALECPFLPISSSLSKRAPRGTHTCTGNCPRQL